MLFPTACEALQKQKCLELRYEGLTRIVEVHAVGVSGNGTEFMRVWQVLGGSHSGAAEGWKLMRLDDARSPRITEFDSAAPRDGYVRDDPLLDKIYCQV
jgi:hypothetical protein